MIKTKLFIASVLACAAFTVSAQNIATVNGKPIPKSLQDQWIAQLIANGGKDTPEARTKDPKVQFALDYARFRILQEAVLRDELAKHPVTDKEVKDRYDREKAALGSQEFDVSHILVKDEKTAKMIEDKLAKGGDFAALAKEYSIDPGAKDNGGELGWNRPAVFVSSFANA